MKVKTLIKEYYLSPIGPLEIILTDKGLSSINFTSQNQEHNGDNNNYNNNVLAPITVKEPNSYNSEITIQLDEYFSGKRLQFNLNMDLQGTSFQKKVWQEMLNIPYGTTLTYSRLASNINHPKAARAVGMACNKNPIIVMVPCHRVIGANGNLTGYAGGLLKKQWLLNHENDIGREKIGD